MAAPKCPVDSFLRSMQSIHTQPVENDPFHKQIKARKSRRSRCSSPAESSIDDNEGDGDGNNSKNDINACRLPEKIVTTSKKPLPSILRPPKRRSSVIGDDDDPLSPRRRSSVTFFLHESEDDDSPSDVRGSWARSDTDNRPDYFMERQQMPQTIRTTTNRTNSTNMEIKKSLDLPIKKRFSDGDVTVDGEAKREYYRSTFKYLSKHVYQVGDTLRPSDLQCLIRPQSCSVRDKGVGEDDEVIKSISALKINDHAFVKRSNGDFTYAILSERFSDFSKNDNNNRDDCLLFIISPEGHSKLIKRTRWLDMVRPLKRNDYESMTSECQSPKESQNLSSTLSYVPLSTKRVTVAAAAAATTTSITSKSTIRRSATDQVEGTPILPYQG
ncbi:hypothetical protein ACHAXS_000646 [Conticribra weissflogii]